MAVEVASRIVTESESTDRRPCPGAVEEKPAPRSLGSPSHKRLGAGMPRRLDGEEDLC
jgi:hypothetical protein